ncbi:MAG: nuclear transport factor 2 family protein [Candidatus Tectimicrobiota bacterium]
MEAHDNSVAQVKRSNERFYRAFETLDINSMAAVWVQAERAKCVHPGWELLSGWDAIRRSWEGIFANTDYMRFVITDVVVHVYGQMAWVTCIENLSDAPDSLQMARMLATNIYEYNGATWLMVHHHASPILRPAPARSAGEGEFLN